MTTPTPPVALAYTKSVFNETCCPISQTELQSLITENERQKIPTAIGILTSSKSSTRGHQSYFDGLMLCQYMAKGGIQNPLTRERISQVQYVWNKTLDENFEEIPPLYCREILIACNDESPLARMQSALFLAQSIPENIQKWVSIIEFALKALLDRGEADKIAPYIDPLISLISPLQLPQAAHLLCVLQAAKSDPNHRLQFMEQLAAQEKSSLSLLFAAFIQHEQLGQPEEAISLLRKAITIDPSFTALVVFLGELLSQCGQHQAAIAHIEPHIQNEKYTPLLLSLYGELISLNDPKKGLTYLSKALNMMPDNQLIRARYATHLTLYPTQCEENPQKIFENIIRARPSDPSLYLRYAIALRGGGYGVAKNSAYAIQILKKAHALNAHYLPIIIALAACYLDLGTSEAFASAHIYFQQIDPLHPQSPYGLLQIARYWLYLPDTQQRNPKLAAELIQQAYANYQEHNHLNGYISLFIHDHPILSDYLSSNILLGTKQNEP